MAALQRYAQSRGMKERFFSVNFITILFELGREVTSKPYK
jgi:hypothetical protein